ncbi:MAG: type I glyceraldehyde-3-phosphate dehydrogenase [Flavobacteriales bacterium]
MIRIGINGFGRIGRTFFKLISELSDMEVVMINDPQPLAALAHLLKYDSIHGPFKGEIALRSDNKLEVNNKLIEFTHSQSVSDLSWPFVDVVLDASGKFKSSTELQNHLNSGAKSVVLTVPPIDDSMKMIVMGVNETQLDARDKIISNASCTTNSAAHLIKLVHEAFTIESCFITTIHSYTSDQNLLDAPHRDLRRSRAAAQSIIPTTTGAAKALTKIFPDLSHIIGGCGIRVPVPNGSLTDLTFNIKGAPSVNQLNKLVMDAASQELSGIVQYTEDPIVSKDIVGNTHSCIYDSELTSIVGDMVKLVGWYDNEMGYSSRLVDLIRFHQSLV